MYMAKQEFIQESEMHNIPCDFEIQTDYLIPARRTSVKKNKICRLLDFAIEPQSEQKKINKSLDLFRPLKKKLWNMRLMVILTVFGAPGMVPKGLVKSQEEQEIKQRKETIQTAALFRYLAESWRPVKTCRSDFSENLPGTTDVKKSQGVKD